MTFHFARLCRPEIAAYGIVALALAVGSLELPEDQTLQTETAVDPPQATYVKFSGREPVGDIAACARRVEAWAHKALPARSCVEGVCAWTISVSAYSRGSWPLWRTVCKL